MKSSKNELKKREKQKQIFEKNGKSRVENFLSTTLFRTCTHN